MSEKKEKTITLVMIVKNESKVISRCFDSVKDYIDYWVICDTGSTDGTQQIIKDYFEKVKIPGELYEHEWKNFGHNRSLAVQAAKNKSDYSLLIDADFIFVPKDKNFKQDLTADGYQIKYEGGLDYRQMLFVKSSLDWKYVGVTHEYITCGKPGIFCNLDSFTIFHKGDGGSRNDKFTRDITLLEQGLKEEPDNPRYMFYLAQSYKDTCNFTKAIEWYEKRVEKGGWSEEVYFSLYQIGFCKIRRGDTFDDFKNDLLKAYNYRPSRLEALYELVKYCRLNGMSDLGFHYGKQAINNEYPNDVLFIIKIIHEYMFFDEVALCAYNTHRSKIAIEIYNKFLQKGVIPQQDAQRIVNNYNFFKERLIEEIHNENNRVNNSDKVAIIIVSTGDSREVPNIVEKLNKTVKHPKDIILVGNYTEVFNKNVHLVKLNNNLGVLHNFLLGVNYINLLESTNNEKYFAYCFVRSSVKLTDKKDLVTNMVDIMKKDISVVGVHPSLTTSSNPSHDVMINDNSDKKQTICFMENIFSCYRASWFNKNGAFEQKYKYDTGAAIDLGYLAYRNNQRFVVDNSLQVKCTCLHQETKLDDIYEDTNHIFNNKYENNFFNNFFKKKLNVKKDYILLNSVENKINIDNSVNKKDVDTKINIDNSVNKKDVDTKINNNLVRGLSFLIRAKNEDKNIVECLDTLVKETEDLDDIEIIVVDNNSSDKTYELANNYVKESKRNIKLYKYEKTVCKIGNNSKTEDTETIATYYNWCLEKVTKYNVIKWDADFIVHKNNLKDMIIEHKLNTRDDNFTLWFTGETLFWHNNEYLKKVYSYYDSYKGFSKRHCNKWKDYSNICEYIDIENISNKVRYEKPIFYEIFRTDVNEFSNKDIMMDIRDKIDNYIHTELKRNSIFYQSDNKSQLEKFKFPDTPKIDRKTYFVVYYGYHMNTGGTYVTLKTYVDYFLEKGDIVYIFERMPCDEEVSKLKPDCIISAQFANSDINKSIEKWNLPFVVLTFAPNQYCFNGPESKYPSLVTYSNSFIKSRDPLQKNGYIVRDPVNHTLYTVSKENKELTYITLIGSPPNVKGHDIFIKLAEKMPDKKFMLVTHEKEFKEKTFPKNIKLQGYLKNIEELKEKVYSKTKVLLLPSIQEAYGRVTIEAIASDIPCILSDYPGLSDATYRMSNYVTNYKDVDEWKKELERVLENYEDEVIKSSKIREKLDFNKDVKYFGDLVEKCIIEHNK